MLPGPAATLPAGFQRSAWPDLDPSGRALFLEEILIRDSDLEVSGTVDYESSLEPLLLDKKTGQLVSLAGEIVTNQPPGSSPLTIDVFPGGFTFMRLAIIALAGIIFIMAIRRA